MAGFIFLGCLLALFAAFGVYEVGFEGKPVKSGKPVPAVAPKGTGLSVVANEVYKEYMSLPVESRPFDNILDILTSLDKTTEHIKRDRDNHFDANYRNRVEGYASEGMTRFKFSWSAKSRQVNGSRYLVPCNHEKCEFATYVALHAEIGRVKAAVAEKRLAMVLSENAHNVSMADELVKALREEAGIQKSVAEQLKSGELQ